MEKVNKDMYDISSIKRDNQEVSGRFTLKSCKTTARKCTKKCAAIDLIHDTRHLCMRLIRTDGIKAMSRGFSGGKQVIKSANARDRGRVCKSRHQTNKNFLSER